MVKLIPFLIGLSIGVALYSIKGWYGFLIVFPWIGMSISIGTYLRTILPKKQKHIARKVSILLILPSLLFFVPIANNENFQLEGIIFLILIGYWSKGIIHYAIAKIFGPLIWGRGFCGWACWTAAVLDWLPIQSQKKSISGNLRNFRFVTLFISISLPLALVYAFGYDVKQNYLYASEMKWMFIGNTIYYLIAIPLAFFFNDKRAFCKMACPVSLVMKIPSKFARIRRRPGENQCISCCQCNERCPMDVDVMTPISQGKPVDNTECILCNECILNCPAEAIR